MRRGRSRVSFTRSSSKLRGCRWKKILTEARWIAAHATRLQAHSTSRSANLSPFRGYVLAEGTCQNSGGVCGLPYYPPITHNLAKHQNEREGEIERLHTPPEK
jgi:hypothetical protein